MAQPYRMRSIPLSGSIRRPIFKHPDPKAENRITENLPNLCKLTSELQIVLRYFEREHIL